MEYLNNANKEGESEGRLRLLYDFILKSVQNGTLKEEVFALNRYDSINIDEFETKREKNDHDLSIFKRKIKEQMIDDFLSAVDDLKQLLVLNSQTFDDILCLKSRYKRVNRNLQLGKVDFAYADREITKIENAFFYIVNNLDPTQIQSLTN